VGIGTLSAFNAVFAISHDPGNKPCLQQLRFGRLSTAFTICYGGSAVVRRILRHLRSNPVAYLALFIALGGTSVAAVSAVLPKNSVGTLQVRNGSLLKQDFRAGQLPAGAAGAAGAAGPAGPAGPAGAAGATTITQRTVAMGPFQNAGGGAVSCNAGQKVVSGGAQISLPGTGDYLQYSTPLTNGWSAGAYIGSGTKILVATALCAAP